ncbi:MarR family transcriptional regulator [Curvibacter sp. CHRR-16]|uniref:MarR family winged helix-turn-helix transcriptional regulator n=1 Tax=Curvibacter sp. CHRR-16 TaxID=2835872 RepID=UPI001BDB048F|nr:MarR family transcriptional regulator [Curvibacter sp. CHRR-16]MBT0570508.1 MarR family transcriptional regulator [Curvibacter sp. CHRR-16]
MPSDKELLHTDQALQLDKQLCFALYSTSLAMTKLYKPLLQALDVTYPQYLALLALWEQDGQSVSSLGEKLFLDSGTLTPLLKRMEQAGLLQRQRSPADERRVTIHLTAAGQALKEKARSIPFCVFSATSCPLSELVELTRQIQGLRQRLLSSVAPAANDSQPLPPQAAAQP